MMFTAQLKSLSVFVALLVTVATTAVTAASTASSSYEAEYSFLRANRALKDCHDCSCFTCDSNSVVDNGDGTISVSVKHCKDGTISWMCCVGINGGLGGCDVDKTCTPEDSNHAKCNTIGSDGLTVTMPNTATKFSINTHDGQTGGDADMINSQCGGNGNQGGGCTNPTAHCLVEYDLLTDCGYSSGGGGGTPDTPAPITPDTPAPITPDTPAPVAPSPSPGNYVAECPGTASVLLLDQQGSTPLADSSNLPIKVISRDPAQVTFEVVNTLTNSGDGDLDYVYVGYYDEDREEKCVEHLAWPVSAKSSTFTAVCGANSKATLVHLYVADTTAVSASDAAAIQKCCHGPENIPTVHYVFEVHCVCPEMTS